MSYNYGDYKQQNNYAQPYPGPPSRQPTARSGATSFDANPSGAGTRMNSFDPYSATSSRQQLNDGAGMRYRDDVSARPAVETAVEGAGAGAGVRRSASHWSPTTPMSRNPINEKSDFRSWRKDNYDNSLWTKGGGLYCVGRFCCCTILIAVFLILSIVLTIAVYVRPPDVTFDGIALDTDKGAIDASTPGAFTINLKVSLTVRNPNFFSAGFESITAQAFYPVTGQADTPVGGGNKTNVNFGSDTTSSIDFPLGITYSSDIDPNQAVILDIVDKCGILTGASPKDLPIKYTLTLKIKILAATISPAFSGNANFPCPASELKLLASAFLPAGTTG
ncbi:hypothetical protein EXIGLDRAFT_731830 [Exidia glandulosa HHB12029]|uniref:Late embryogenesis abundant protein LEA-2 subgroup domain-containing protein n=1 Tax=Exidia glandulosa HHB12029 TaxID=1314781 RepID=A0A165KWQ9_EXIGL|nr:hypothetical protein EXIGLDRAFT_731830 [Exidia glandulosa HHB12029]